MSEPLHIGLELSLPCSSRVLVGLSFRMITTIMSRGKVVTYRILQARHMSLDSDLSGHNRLPTSTRSHPCRRWYVNLLRPVGFIFRDLDEDAAPWWIRVPVSWNLMSKTGLHRELPSHLCHTFSTCCILSSVYQTPSWRPLRHQLLNVSAINFQRRERYHVQNQACCLQHTPGSKPTLVRRWTRKVPLPICPVSQRCKDTAPLHLGELSLEWAKDPRSPRKVERCLKKHALLRPPIDCGLAPQLLPALRAWLHGSFSTMRSFHWCCVVPVPNRQTGQSTACCGGLSRRLCICHLLPGSERDASQQASPWERRPESHVVIKVPPDLGEGIPMPST